MNMQPWTRNGVTLAALALAALLTGCGGSDDTAENNGEASAAATSSAVTESEACKQFDQLNQQLESGESGANVSTQLQQIEQAAKAEGDTEAESAARELLSNEGTGPGWDEALEQMEAVCGGERAGDAD